ncbi:YwdI family protein [Peribacillus sp. Hz7]|uniref:YwdI family protein n=1 Tax=Peribacillus sp. Hz7 TaxID=3344873 RepID=UPI0035C990EA
MQISSKQVLEKMEELVARAKQADSEDALKGYIMAVQALCEVMVNEQPPTSSLHISQPVKQMTTMQPMQHTTTVPITERVKTEGANGSSLLDF